MDAREFKQPVKKATLRARLRRSAKAWRERQPSICPICCTNQSSEEHHIIRKGMGGSLLAECDDNRILICRECHAGFHAGHIPLACVLRAKRDVSGLNVPTLERIAGRFLPDLVEGETTDFVV